LKHADLVAQSQILQLDRSARMEDRRQSCEERSEKNKHRRELWKKTNPHPLKHFEIIERHRHENETLGDGYSKMKDDVAFRLEQAEITGLGFAPPPETTDVVRIVRKNQATTKVENAA